LDDQSLKEHGGLYLPGAPKPERRAGGVIIVDGICVADTVQCVHCGRHWVAVKGSGKVRGWCFKCNGPFCGPGCTDCYPMEKRLTDYEKGLIGEL
jgi:hypothetical protein